MIREGVITAKIILSSAHPLDELAELVNNLKQSEEDVFSQARFILILPDNLTINNAREKIIELSSPRELAKVHLTTIEDLAASIIKAASGHIPRILPDESRRAILSHVMKKIKNNVQAEKIWGIINSESPETQEVLKDLYDEFEEFLGCINAPPYDDEGRRCFKELTQIAEKLPDDYSREYTINTLRLYEQLLTDIEKELKSLSIDDYFTRTYLVKEATGQISYSKDKIFKIFPEGTQVWVSGISVFNTSALLFLAKLASVSGNIRINAGKMTLERLEKRLKSVNGMALEFEHINSRLPPDQSGFEMIEVPDLRREVEAVAIKSSELCRDGIKPSDIVVIARDIGAYLPYAENIMKDYGIASHVQTRRRLSLTPAYRLIASLLELLAMVEKDEPIPASAIVDPLRLGFRKYNTRWNRSMLPALHDKKFLWIETQVGIICQGKDLTWSEWKERLEKRADKSILELIEWVEENRRKPGTKPINEVVQPIGYAIEDFARSCVWWESPLSLNNGFSYDRFEVCTPHITSQSGWLHSLIERLNEYSSLYAKIRGENKLKTWEDIKYGFYAIAGTETYGIPLKDACATRFVDAGISHFIDGKVRFILGLKSEGFPRKCPKPFLLGNKFRELVNEKHSILYFRDPITDYENEMDFFDIAIGPRPYEERIIFIMPYLDDRGHREEWSIFVKKNDRLKRIAVSDIFHTRRSTIAPAVYWKSIVTALNDEGSLAENFCKAMDKRWEDVLHEIFPRLKAVETRIIKRDDAIKVDDEECISKLIKDIKNNPIPAHELDLFIECPAMYYFYRYLYALGLYTKGDRKGSRHYIPEWKYDFSLGPIPLPVRRHFISCEMQDVLADIIKKYPSIRKLKANLSAINSLINASRQLEYYGRRRLLDIIEFIIEDADPDSDIEFRSANTCSGDEEIWRPGYVIYTEDTGLKKSKKMVFFARTGPRLDKEICILHHHLGKRVECPGAKKSYYSLNGQQNYEQLKSDFRLLAYPLIGKDTGACSSCVYSTLCGEWGFI